MKTKTEKCILAGAIVLGGATAVALFPYLAPSIKAATFIGVRNTLK